MATSDTPAQAAINCDLCDRPTQQFCNSCQVKLCDSCVADHRDEFSSLSHEIVPMADRKFQLVFPECSEHPGQRCEVHCKKCKRPVCLRCCIISHRNHAAEDLSEIVKRRKEEIRKETEEIDNYIPQYQAANAKLEEQLLQKTEKYNEYEKKIEQLKRSWQEETKRIFDKLVFQNRSLQNQSVSALLAQRSKVENTISDMRETIEHNEIVQASNVCSEVNKCTSKLGEYQKIPKDIHIKVPRLYYDSVPGIKLCLEFGEVNVVLSQKERVLPNITSTLPFLKNRKQLPGFRVIATINTGYDPLRSIACVGNDASWIIDSYAHMKQIDINGERTDNAIDIGNCWPNEISVSRDGELVFSDCVSGKVMIIKNGILTQLISAPPGWHPGCLSCTKSGDLLLQLKHKGMQHQDMIIRCCGKEITQVIDSDQFGNPIFSTGTYHLLYITENINADVCVSDVNAGEVLVVNKFGKVLFRYDGKSAQRNHSFSPRCIVTDSMNQIIVTDSNNECLHILDNAGRLQRCVDNCGLVSPGALSIDGLGRLWVGLFDSGQIKVIDYLQSTHSELK